MDFNARYSRASERLLQPGAGGWEVHDRAVAMQRAGEDVIMLCVGDPDFRTPTPIIDNAVSYLHAGRTHYSPALGELKLRRAVADLESSTSPHPCSVDEVAIFPGATAALAAVMNCLLNPGDEVVVPEPMYVGYPPMMHAIDATLVPVPLENSAGFSVDVPTLFAACSERTRVILLNTPGNPTGSIIPQATLREVAAFCCERGIWMVCDEVYSMFAFDGQHRSARASAAALDNVVMIDGLSKSHAMSGWRIGWVVAPQHLILRLGAYAGATQFGCPQFIQDAAAFALEIDQPYVESMCNEYRGRRDFVLEQLRQQPMLGCSKPSAGMFIMCDVSATGLSGQEFADQLLDTQKVSVVPGQAFGPSAARFVRIGLAQSRQVLREACERIGKFCSSLADAPVTATRTG